MLLPDGLSTNAYRILRLSANASASEVHKAADRARRDAALGVPPENDVDVSLLGALPRTDGDVRAAVGTLGNPAHRLRERLFWFHQLPGAELPDPSAAGSEFAVGDLVEIISRHDEALRGLFNAFHAKLDDAGAAAWVRALRRWHGVVADDSYWALSVAIENRGGFIPRALPTEVQSVRSGALSFAAHGLLVEGRDAVSRNDAGSLRRVLAILTDLNGTGSWADAAHDEIASSAVARFTKRCREIRETGGLKIVREKLRVAVNRPVAEATIDRYRKEAEPELKELVSCFPPDHDLGRRVREAAAQCLYGIASDFTWADRYILSAALCEEALELAKGTALTTKIETALASARYSVRDQRYFGKVESISFTPSVRAILGFGFKLYGQSEYDSVSHSHEATRYIVGLFLPILPLARYRVVKQNGNSFRFLGKLPLRKGDRWHQAIVAAGLFVWFAVSAASSSGGETYRSSASTYNPSAYPTTSPTSGSDAKLDSAGLPDFSDLRYSSPAAQKPPSSSADLLPRIDRGRVRMKEARAQLRSDKAEIEVLITRIYSLGSYLEVMKPSSGAPRDIAFYNENVDAYNDMVRTKRRLFAAYDANLSEYEAMLAQDKRLVAQYNGNR